MESAKKKVLLLGLGFFGAQWYRALKSMPNCTLAGVSALQDDAARLSGDGFDPKATFTDYREAIEKMDADIAIIVLPTPLHTGAAQLALQKGMNVLSEKPLTFSWEDAKDILQFKAAFPRLKYVVSQNYRWRPPMQTLKRCIDSGDIGEVGDVHIEFRRPEDLIGYRTSLEMPLLQDVCIHHFDLLRFLTGRNCEEVYANAHRQGWSGFDGKSSADVIISMEGGITACYSGTWSARGKITSWNGMITVSGSKGCLATDADDRVYLFRDGDSAGTPVEPVAMEYTEQRYAVDMLMKSIDGATTAECSLEDNYHSFAMACAAEESAKKRTPVTL